MKLFKSEYIDWLAEAKLPTKQTNITSRKQDQGSHSQEMGQVWYLPLASLWIPLYDVYVGWPILKIMEDDLIFSEIGRWHQ